MQIQKHEIIKMEIVEYLLKLPDALSFKNAEDEIIVLFTDTEAAEKRSAEIRQRFQAGWGEDHTNVVRPFWLYLPHSGVTDRAENFLYLIRYVRQNEKELSEHVFFTIEKDSVEKMYREKETEQMILDAMEEDRVEVFYQPIFSTEKHRITSGRKYRAAGDVY